MIPDLKLKVEREPWQKELKNAFTKLDDLLIYLQLDKSALPVQTSPNFKLRVPRAFAQKMKKGCPSDPLLKQVLPLQQESKLASGYTLDPLQESKSNPVPGLLHKFPNQVLLITGQACAVHCRYCFRQHFPYQHNRINKDQWLETFRYIQQRSEITEVILSGGDPLSLPDATLKWFIDHLQSIPHLKWLRLHSRTASVMPTRVTPNLAKILGDSKLKTTLVFHINHPQEIQSDVTEAASRLQHHAVTLLNQSVLLGGVNDQGSILVELSHRLFETGIMPYYLHQLDSVQGSAHFQITSIQTEAIIRHLYEQLPGYLIPRIVKEVPGLLYKLPMNLSFLGS